MPQKYLANANELFLSKTLLMMITNKPKQIVNSSVFFNQICIRKTPRSGVKMSKLSFIKHSQSECPSLKIPAAFRQ